MVRNQKCYECSLMDICKAAAKLKPFSDEAKVDLGVTIEFIGCESFRPEYIEGDCEDRALDENSEEE